MSNLRYIEIAAPGGPEMLRIMTAPIPEPAPGEVLIRVAAAGLNRADLLQRQGHYPPPPGASLILGMEVSGEIVALGDGGGDGPARWHVGDQVCALLAGGGYAEYCVAPAGQCMAIPEGLSLREAAAIPEAAITVWANLFSPRRVFDGDFFLVQGGSSGIGSMAIQMAHSFGARVATTAGTDEKCRLCLTLGAGRSAQLPQPGLACSAGAMVSAPGHRLHPRHGRRRLLRQTSATPCSPRPASSYRFLPRQ